MPKFVIEREFPGAGKLTTEELKGVSLKSNEVIEKMSHSVQWIKSYITNDKIYCVYNAKTEEMVRDHAQQAGFPANLVSRVSTVIDPVTSE